MKEQQLSGRETPAGKKNRRRAGGSTDSKVRRVKGGESSVKHSYYVSLSKNGKIPSW